MQCLYCGKGIGPIRQLRDLEFCSEAHRTQFRERYRQELYEALAPEPAPAKIADFIGRATVTAGPAPTVRLLPLAKSLPGNHGPAIGVEVAGVSVERPGWVSAQRLAAMPARLAWLDSAAVFPSLPQLVRMVPFSMCVQPPHRPAAGAAPTRLVAGNSVRPPAAAPHMRESGRSLSYSVSLPGAAQIAAPAAAAPASPQLHAAIPVCSDPVAIGAMPAPIHAPVSLPPSTTIAGPAAPQETKPALEAGLSPALVASQPRPLEAGPLPIQCDLKSTVDMGLPVALEGPFARNIGVILPKPPAAAASSTYIRPVQPEARLAVAAEADMLPAASGAEVGRSFSLALEFGAFEAYPPATASEARPMALAPMAATSDPQPAALPAASPSWHEVGQWRPIDLSRPQPFALAPIGALTGLAQPGGSQVREAAGNRSPHSVEAALARTVTPAARHELSALPAGLHGEMRPALPRPAEAPAPAAPTAAVPSWDATLAAPEDHPLVPLANIALPRIDCLPSPAGAIDELGLPLPAVVGRAVRSCAVLWTLRVVRICNPPFEVDPVRVRFHDLAERSMLFNRDLEDKVPAKTNLRPFKRLEPRRASQPKWAFIGAVAAALLLAAGLQVVPKGSGGSLPWHGMSIGQWMSQRATRTFADDFRAGLNQWKGVQPKWPKSWSYSTDGFIHPGQLALYRPSVPLSDYRFEFMAQIETKSVDWVVRAKDADNYYALKFTVVQPGPRPMVAMVRYPVIGGHAGARVQTPLRMMIHANTPYRVAVDVKGNRYRAYVEDQEADFWTDDHLKTGGVGFFSEAGEHARVYWVKLESHGDLLGRICGLLSGKSSKGATNKEIQAMDYRHAGTTDRGSGPGGVEADINTAQDTRISRVLSKAASLHLDGKLDEASRELVRALDGGERHPALYFALGQLQYEMQEYGPAAQSYGQAALLQPLHPTAHFNAGVCLGRIERWEDAAAAFRKAISNDPSRTEAHLALGACLVQLGLHNEALDAYDRFLERHPDHEEALFGKAVALQKRDRSSEAVELYRRILNRSPNSEEALSNLVSLSLANQDYAQVRKYAQRLAEAQPKSQIALEGLAGAAFAAGDHKAAADYSRKLAEMAPQVFENWFNLGVACHKAGDLANASDAYARATRVQTDSPQAHLNLGVSLQEQGDLKGARAAYQRALEIDPKLAGVHWNLGLVHEQLGDLEAAENLLYPSAGELAGRGRCGFPHRPFAPANGPTIRAASRRSSPVC